MDVVFLSFANNQFQRLSHLGREEDGITNSLRPRATRSHFFLEKHSIAEKKHISAAITQHWENIVLFHFSGHANPEELELSDGAGKMTTLSQLLGLQKNLKLIFLNGCSTYGHVEAYLKAGVPAVIATETPVIDEVAADFSSFFYEALSLEGVSIREAFHLAKGKVALLHHHEEIGVFQVADSLGHGETRGIKFGGEAENKFNWGLYYLEEGALDWSLPYQPLAVNASVERIDLTEHLVEVFKNYCRDIRRLAESEEEGEIVNPGEYRAAIIKCLPATLGVQVRKLFIQLPEDLSMVKKEHIEQAVAVYNVLMEMLAFTMINQLWEAHLSKPLPIREDQKAKVRLFLKLNEEERKIYNFVELIRSIRQIFEDNQIDYFVKELEGLKDILALDQEFAVGHSFMESMKWLLANDRLDISALPNNYLLAENYLVIFLKKLGFCAKYRMTAIKNINLVQPRHISNPVYSHSLVQLIACGTYDADRLPYNEYAYSRSVIMLKSLKNVEEFLTLTPFVIDKNAHDEKSRKSNILFFSHYDSSAQSFVFRRADKPQEKLEVRKTKVNDLREKRRLSGVQQYHNELVEQFDAFTALFFNQTFDQL